MDEPEYVELHLHTSFSFLDGASQPSELITRAKELGYHALAITDHDGLHGAMEFAKLAQNEGLRPITGAELTLIDGSHLTLLAETQVGYRNLSRLITATHRTQRLDAPRWLSEEDSSTWADEQDDLTHHYRDPEKAPWLDPALLPGHAEGLILLTGCRQGQLARLVDAGNLTEAESLLRQYIAWFGAKNVFVELQQNYVHGDTPRINLLVQLARKVGVGYVATGNVHYHAPDRHRLQDVLVAIRHRSTLDECHRQRRPNAQFFLCSVDEMKARFARYPEALATSVVIANRCAKFNLNDNLGYDFPSYPTQPGEIPVDALARICATAFEHRYPPGHPRRTRARKRLNYELGLIKHRKLAGFFLIHYDLLELARAVAIEVRGPDTYRAKSLLPPGRGRGSSVSSVVCYLIGLSPVDPIAYKLSVGRFLNGASSAPPDIDLDFPRDIRERLLERIHADYGDRAAMICAFATYRLRSAVRDVGKALGLPMADLDRIAKLSEPTSAKVLSEELNHVPTFAKRKHEPPWSYLIELAAQLSGFPRHITQHSGGMIVSSSSISEMVPVQPAAMDGRFLCQWDKDSCDDAGFVKIDFLALGMLSLVEETMTLIGETYGEPPDLSQIDFEDQKVYKMIQAGDTVGTFQIESRAQIQSTLRTQPMNLEDLTVQVAIIRPGPIIGGATTPYIERRRNPDFKPTYDHPRLEKVLHETLGVILFQEQVVDVAVELAGFTTGQADSLRRAMSRRRSLQEMEKSRQDFYDGAARKGVDEETAKRVFDKLLGFSSYGFPKGHAASFAVLGYQSCWLKLYYPAEFLCALLNNQPMGFYPPHMFINDAKRHGTYTQPPDINLSGVKCTVVDSRNRRVRIGLAFIKGLGEADAQTIVDERTANGAFKSLADFIRRVSIRQDAIENMIEVGTFDSFGLGRREALWQVGLFVLSRRFGQERTLAAKARKPNRISGLQPALPLPIEQDFVELSATSIRDRVAADYCILGMSPLYHPLGIFRPRLQKDPTVVTTQDIEALPHGTPIRIGGLVVCRQRPGTAKGVTFLLIEDELGIANVIVYRGLYDTQRVLVRSEPFLMIAATVQREDRNLNLIATRFRRLESFVHSLPPTGTNDDLDDEIKIITNLTPSSHNYR